MTKIISEPAHKTMREVLLEEKNLADIISLVKEDPQIKTKHLAKYLCKKHSFIAPNKTLQTSGCVAVLKDFHNSGKIFLSSIKEGSSYKFTSMVVSDDTYPLPINFPKAVHDLKEPLEIEMIEHGDKVKGLIYNNLMNREHPLKNTRLAGYLIKYLIKYQGCYIGACAYSSCAINLEARDKWLSWSQVQKTIYQQKVINMSRFLIRKDVHCENLASHLLSKLIMQVKKDWVKIYNIVPWLIESFIDTEHYAGTCYKAANWKHIGVSKGRGRNDTDHENAKSKKDVYIYVLEPNFRMLGDFPPEPIKYSPMELETNISSDMWSKHEFGGVNLGDKRLTDRVESIAALKYLQPSQSFPAAAKGQQKVIAGYYKFLDNKNEEITPDALIETHRNNTICRALYYKDIISAHDTTTFNFKGLEETEGLGPIGSNEKSTTGAKGLNAHVTLACTRDGIPLGILGVDYLPPREICKRKKNENGNKIRAKKAFEKSELFRWVKSYQKDIEITEQAKDLRITTVMDREADLFELLIIANKNRERNPIIVRSKHDREVVMADGSCTTIKECLKNSKNIENKTIAIPAQRKSFDRKTNTHYPYLKEREAEVEIRHETVHVKPPKKNKLKNLKPIKVNILHIKEINPPEGAKDIEWYLTTTREINETEDIFAVIEDYTIRWKIEELFRTIKSGCRAESQKLNHAEKIKRIISISFVVAWRIMLLATLSRTNPTLPSEKVFHQDEVEILSNVVKKKFIQ